MDLLIKQSKEVFRIAGKIVSVDTMVAENQLRGYCIIHCSNKNVKMSFTLSPENPALIQEYHLNIVENSN